MAKPAPQTAAPTTPGCKLGVLGEGYSPDAKISKGTSGKLGPGRPKMHGYYINTWSPPLGGGFKYFLFFTPNIGEMIQFD